MSNKWMWISIAAAVGWYFVSKRQEAQRLAAYQSLMDRYQMGSSNQASAFAPAPCECGPRQYGARVGARLWQPTEGVRL